MHKREEEFRRADNERMRRFFNARFDDIPGALGRAEGGNLMRDQPLFKPKSEMELKKYESFAQQVAEGTRGTGNAETELKLLENKNKRL